MCQSLLLLQAEQEMVAEFLKWKYIEVEVEVEVEVANFRYLIII